MGEEYLDGAGWQYFVDLEVVFDVFVGGFRSVQPIDFDVLVYDFKFCPDLLGFFQILFYNCLDFLLYLGLRPFIVLFL